MVYFREGEGRRIDLEYLKMDIGTMIKNRRAQTAIEYLLLLMAVVAIVLIGFKLYMPRIQETSNIYYNRAASGIVGKPPSCGDGDCSFFEDLYGNRCPADCN